MSKGTTCSKAIQQWEAAHPGESATEAETIKLHLLIPPIEKMVINYKTIKIK